MAADETVMVSARIPARLARRLDRAAGADKLAPDKTQIIIMGLQLVLEKFDAERREKEKSDENRR